MSEISLIPFSEEETARLKKLYPKTVVKLGQRYVRTRPGNCVLPSGYAKFKDRFANWNLRTDDTYVLTFPKNGTTWTQELIWCVCNNVDIEKAKATPLVERAPFLEHPLILDKLNERGSFFTQDPVSLLENKPSPRIIKSHLPFCLLPEDLLDKCKVVSCLRNPKDTAVSFYHHEKLMESHGYDGDYANHFDLFMENMVTFCPYFDYVTEMWKRRDHPNLCILFFEDMKKDQAGSIKKVAKFLNKELTEEQIERLVDHLSFKNMRQNDSVNMSVLLQKGLIKDKSGSFIRKGEVGDWKNYFTDEMNRRMDEAIEKHLKPIGLEFRYE